MTPMPRRQAKPPRLQRYRGFDEERAPCGRAGILYFVGPAAPFDTRRPDIADCLVSLPRPFMAVIWEPLLTKAPAPPKARPYCCYLRTVIFYCSPYIKSPWTKLYRDNDGRVRANGRPELGITLMGATPQEAYRHLWNALHGEAAWVANPWVVATTFSVIGANIDAPAARAA